MTLHAFLPGIDLILFATVVLMVFRDRIKPTFKFWIYCIGISYASKLITASLLLVVFSNLPFEVDSNYHYLRFPIWLMLSIYGIYLFTQKILKQLQMQRQE